MAKIDIILWVLKGLIMRRKKPTSPFGELNVPVKRRGVRLIQVSYVPSLVENWEVLEEKKIYKVCQCISAISLLSLLEKGRDPVIQEINL